MIDEILSSRSAGRHLVALREAGRLMQVVRPRAGAPDAVGAVVLGRLTAVLAGMEAGFVDIGAERAGFLSFVARAGDGGEEGAPAVPAGIPNEGAPVLVQVTKAPQAGKGAGLTRNIALPGRYLVYTPFQPRISISRRIEDADTRARLEATLAGLIGEEEGFILRTAAAGADAEALAADVAALRRRWSDICAAVDEGVSPPALVGGESGGLAAVLRDFAGSGLRRIVADDAADADSARAFCETYLDGGVRVETWSEREPLFAALGVDDAIAEALEPQCALPCGGTLVIEETQAVSTVDVNTGRHMGRGGHAETVLATNLEAAAEIPRQLRLRGLGGMTVIDFIHMDDPDHRARVLAVLEDGLRADPAFIQVTGFSELGLVELARRRGAGPLSELLAEGGA